MGTSSQPAARGRSTPSRMRTEQELLVEISLKLDRVVAVLAAQGKPREIQIDILSAAGCDSPFIGTVVGLTAGRVRAIQSRRRRTDQATETGDASVEPAVT